jgi:hypothetical protein
LKLLVTGHSANVSSWPVAAVARVTPKFTFTGTHNLQQVPVPATLALVDLGLAGIGYRCKQNKAA